MDRTPRINVGIFLGKSEARVSVLSRNWRGQPKNLYSNKVQADGDIWENNASHLNTTIAELLAKLPKKAKRADARVCVSLPDPLVREMVCVFDDFPTDAKEANKLITWRMAQDMSASVETLRCSFQVVGLQENGIKVIGRSIDAQVFESLQKTMRKQGIQIGRLDGWSGYHFNHSALDQNGICFWSNGEWWVLECRHDETSTSIVSSGWIVGADAERRIADRALRLAKTFTLKHLDGHAKILIDATTGLSKLLAGKVADDEMLTLMKGKTKNGSAFDLAELVAIS